MARKRALAVAEIPFNAPADYSIQRSRNNHAELANAAAPLPVLVEDDALVNRVRRGEAEAFETLVRRYYRAAYAVALGLLGRPADAEDICQEAWLRALERLDELRDGRCFCGWLLQIVRNGARNLLASRRVRASEPLEDSRAAATADPRQDLQWVSERTRLEAALARLEPQQRMVVLLHDLEGWHHREIGEQLEVSEVMSRQLLFQARRRLRKLLAGGEREERRER
ncbi:MAG: sigma-70 family RNA polymerase sigma factor [Candidatus Krumholzibacteria bacterium]|jgi:RNA polymerase sigma-70 factor (ECF subfamily)|nr:sigma-70 family RNA polymerase sigma factor [Candidatus Krumholzibacteria bacterium]